MTIKCTIDQVAGTITWRGFADGDVVLDVSRASETNRKYGMYHGLKQRGTDAMALQASDFGGRVPESAKRAALCEIVEHLHSGTDEWSMRGTGTGGVVALFMRVLIEAYPDKSPEKLAERTKGWMRAQRDAFLMEPRMKLIADRMRAEATQNVDVGALESELDAI